VSSRSSLKAASPTDQPIPQLQYTQTINLVFPPTGSKEPINWPHVTVNTLTKTSA